MGQLSVVTPVRHADSLLVIEHWDSTLRTPTGKRPRNAETAGAGKPTPAEATPAPHGGVPQTSWIRREEDPNPLYACRVGRTPLSLQLCPVGYRSRIVPAPAAGPAGIPLPQGSPTTRRGTPMSSLWTPGGEHPVEPSESPQDPPVDPSLEDPSLEDLSPEDREKVEAMAREMAAVQEQLASTPASVVVANHLMGFYELAAIHLSQQPPNLSEASVAIDALAGVVDTLPGRLGEAEATMRDALHQIRLAYVAVEKAMRETTADDGDEAENETGD